MTTQVALVPRMQLNIMALHKSADSSNFLFKTMFPRSNIGLRSRIIPSVTTRTRHSSFQVTRKDIVSSYLANTDPSTYIQFISGSKMTNCEIEIQKVDPFQPKKEPCKKEKQSSVLSNLVGQNNI